MFLIFYFSILHQHERLGRTPRPLADARVFYTDEENDDIFVGSDDEYKELIKVAAMKNKVGRSVKILGCLVML